DERVIIPLNLGKPGGGKGPVFWCALEDGEVTVIGDEPANTDCDPDPSEKLYRKAKERKLLHKRRLRPQLFSVCLTMKPVGEPDAGDRHVRFDERGWETERCRMAQVTAPILDSAEAAVMKSPLLRPLRGKADIDQRMRDERLNLLGSRSHGLEN